MSTLNDIVQVSITRETTAIARASFGIPGIIAEFATDKTTTTFDRTREYASITELAEDGWTVSDRVYLAAQKIFSQNPKVEKVIVGRKASDDASWDAALSAIQLDNPDWYGFVVIAPEQGKIVYSTDFSASNQIAVSVNGGAISPVTFATDHDTTMTALIAAISALSGVTAKLDSTDVDGRTVLIDVFSDDDITVTSSVTGGSAVSATISYTRDNYYLEIAAWTETQKKIFFLCTSDADVLSAGSTSDIAYLLSALNYDRTACQYHTASQDDATPSWFESAYPGNLLPYDPGSETWAYKTLAGVSSYYLTSGQRTAALNKSCNIYTPTAGVDITEEGKVVSGEWIDIIRGIDWLQARLQEDIFATLVNVLKVPFTDAGITMIGGIIQGVLEEGARAGLLVRESIVLTMPTAASVSSQDKIARLLPDVTFTADLQGAIHKVQIAGVVSV